MENKVVYANAYTINISNQEVLIDFKMTTPEFKDANRPETIVLRVVQTIKAAEMLNLLLTDLLRKTRDNPPPRV